LERSGEGETRAPVLIPQVAPSGIDELAVRPGVERPSTDDGLEEAREARRQPHQLRASRSPGDLVMRLLTTGAAALILVTSIGLFATLAIQSRSAIGQFGFGFLTGSDWNTTTNQFAAFPAIAGTLYTSVLALLLAVPVGLLIAVYLSEMAMAQVRLPLGFLIELLAAIPSIVYGLWALFVLVPLVQQHVSPFLSGRLGFLPFFANASPTGLGILSAALVLSIMVLPTITAISRDVLIAVPRSQREAMLALGATRWETTWKVVVPGARAGIIGAVILGLGRAVGETMAVQMVLGNSQSTSWSVLGLGTSIAATIVNQFQDAFGGLYRASLLELALILLIMAVCLNALARLLVWRVAGRSAT